MGYSAKVWMDNFELMVEFDYSEGCRGDRDEFGFHFEPDFEGEIEIKSVMLGDYDIAELLFPRYEEIKDRLFEERGEWV